MSTVSTEQTSQPPASNLSIQDLQNLLLVVELASSRGAFRAQELSSVGSLFDRVSAFLNNVAPPAAAAPEGAQQEGPRPPEVAAPVIQQPIPMAPVAVPPPFSPKVVP